MHIKKYSTSKKLAMIFTYLQIIAQSVSTLFLTRFYIQQLGEEAYGFYQMIYAVAQYILILDLGISATMIRYIAEFDARDDHKKAENFAFHMMVVMGLILCFIVGVGIAVGSNIGNIYTSFTPVEITLAQKIFRVMILQISATVFSHFAQGIALAYNRYSFVKGVAIMQILVGAVLSVAFVLFGMGIEGIVRANTIVIILNAIAVICFDFFVLKFKIKFHKLDFAMMRPATILMLAMLLQSVIGYVNTSVDKTILGVMTTKHDVAVYSIAATIISMVNALPTAVSSVYQPDAVRLVVKGADSTQINDFISKPGRIQFIITGGFIAGWILFGMDFIKCWTGPNTIMAWAYVLIIMVPNMLPLIQNTILAILNAKDKRIFRSLILGLIVIINIALTVFLVKKIGPIGAPIATGISYIIGHCIIMNIYYWKELKLDVIDMLKKITKGILPCVLITTALCSPLLFIKNKGNWLLFIFKAMVFCVIYAFTLYKWGLNKKEKQEITKKLSKFKKNN